MIIAKNFFAFRYSQTSGGRSCHSQLIFQSSTMRHSSSTGPARNASSSCDNLAGAKARSLAQSGLPVNRSASHHTSPASMASRSVVDRRGSACCASRKIGLVIQSRRKDEGIGLPLAGAGDRPVAVRMIPFRIYRFYRKKCYNLSVLPGPSLVHCTLHRAAFGGTAFLVYFQRVIAAHVRQARTLSQRQNPALSRAADGAIRAVFRARPERGARRIAARRHSADRGQHAAERHHQIPDPIHLVARRALCGRTAGRSRRGRRAQCPAGGRGRYRRRHRAAIQIRCTFNTRICRPVGLRR